VKAKDLGIAVVGSGRIGTLRARLAAKHPAVRFLAVSDKEPANAKALAELAGADFHSADNDEVIARPEVNAVFVSTPEGEHAAPVCKALELGKAVMVEKPLALSLNDAEAILKTLKATGGTLRVGYSRRFKECFLRAKEQMNHGRLGKVSGAVIAGHEPCGVVAAAGSAVDERTARVGDRIMVHHYTGCGTCAHCRTGWSQMCVQGSTVYGATGHGAHAPYMKVPAHTLVALPDELRFSTGAAISCGTGTAYQALRRMNLTGGDTVAVVGQGPVGLSATQLAAAMGARVIALDVSAERLKRAEEFGADVLLDPKNAVAEAYNVSGVPETFIIDRQGRIVAHHSGAFDWSQPAIRDALEELLKDNKG